MRAVRFHEHFEKAKECKQKGNEFIAQGRWAEAAFQFHLVYMFLGPHMQSTKDDPYVSMAMSRREKNATPLTQEEHDEAHALLLASYNNLVLVALNQKRYPRVLELSRKVLNLDPHNLKVRLRRCAAALVLKDLDQAIEDYNYIYARDPALITGTTLMEDLKKARQEHAQSEKNLYRGKLFA